MIIRIDYTNYRGDRRIRTIVPEAIWFGELLPYHPGHQWLLEAIDLEINERRTFAMSQVHSWEPVK